MIGEAKYTDWDALASRVTVRSNLRRHARQLWSYFTATVSGGGYAGIDIATCDRYGALSYPHRPAGRDLAVLAEQLAPTRLAAIDKRHRE